jgi:hypothetical protein
MKAFKSGRSESEALHLAGSSLISIIQVGLLTFNGIQPF